MKIMTVIFAIDEDAHPYIDGTTIADHEDELRNRVLSGNLDVYLEFGLTGDMGGGRVLAVTVVPTDAVWATP